MRLFRVLLLLSERPDAQHFGCWSWGAEHRDPGRGGKLKLKSFLQGRPRPRPLLLQKRAAEADEPRSSRGTQLSTSSFASSKSAGSAREAAHATRQPATLVAPDVNFADDFCLTEDDFICLQKDQPPATELGVDKYKYLGCWNDNYEARTMLAGSIILHPSPHLSNVEHCARYCGGMMNVPGSTMYPGGTNATGAPYVYFAIQGGVWCFCSNDLEKTTSLGRWVQKEQHAGVWSTTCAKCNAAANPPGSASDQAKGLYCGGNWTNSVYEIPIRVDAPASQPAKWTRASQNWESLARPNVYTTISGRSDAKDVAALTRDDVALSYSGDRVTLTRHGSSVEVEDKNMVSVRCRTKAAFKFTNVDVELGTEGERFLNEQLADKQRVITATLKGEKTERTVHRMERQGVRSKNPGLVFELDTSQVGEKLEVQAFLMVPQNREGMKDGHCRWEMTKVDGEDAEVPRCYSVSLYDSNQLDHFKAGLTMLKHLATGVDTEYASQLQGDPQDGHAGNEMVEFHMHADGGFVVKLNRMKIVREDAAARGGGGSSSSLLQRTSATRVDDGGAAKFHSASRAKTEREKRRGAVPLLARRGKGVETEPEPTPQAALAPTTASASSRGESVSTDVNNDGGAMIATGVLSPTSFLQRRGMGRHGYHYQEHVRAKASPKDPVLVVWCGGHWYRTCFTRADPDDWAKKPLSAVATEDDDKQIQSLKLVRASSREGYTSRDVNAFRKQKHAADAFGSAVSDKGMVLFVQLQTYWVENRRSFDENGLPTDLDTPAEMKMPREQIGDLGKAKLKFGAVRISKHAKVTQVAEDAAGYKGPKTCAELWKARGGVMNGTGPPGEERQPGAPPADERTRGGVVDHSAEVEKGDYEHQEKDDDRPARPLLLVAVISVSVAAACCFFCMGALCVWGFDCRPRPQDESARSNSSATATASAPEKDGPSLAHKVFHVVAQDHVDHGEEIKVPPNRKTELEMDSNGALSFG